MGKSTTGPDGIDVKGYVLAIEALHGVTTEVVLEPHPEPLNAVWYVMIKSTWRSAGVFAKPMVVISRYEYNGGDWSGLASALYAWLNAHEVALQKRRWGQTSL